MVNIEYNDEFIEMLEKYHYRKKDILFRIKNETLTKISPKYKIHKGYNWKLEHFWYTRQFCFKYDIFWMLKANVRDSEKWEKYEYEGNEFFFEIMDNKDNFDYAIEHIIMLHMQLRKKEDRKFTVVITAGNYDYDTEYYELGALSVCFYEERSLEKDDNGQVYENVKRIKKKWRKKSMRNVLKKYCETKELVELYVDDDVESPLIGYISGMDEEWLIMNRISQRGEYDGYLMIWIDDIFNVCCRGKQLRKIEALYKMRQSNHEVIKQTGNVFEDYLKYVHMNQRLVTVYWDRDKTIYVTGKVVSYTDEMVEIHKYDEYGKNEGSHRLFIESITRMEYDGTEEQDILTYAEFQKKGRL